LRKLLLLQLLSLRRAIAEECRRRRTTSVQPDEADSTEHQHTD
jgi:hypothetical protein